MWLGKMCEEQEVEVGGKCVLSRSSGGGVISAIAVLGHQTVGAFSLNSRTCTCGLWKGGSGPLA
jgi:hypothetical protein